jgi:hypothetical protein
VQVCCTEPNARVRAPAWSNLDLACHANPRQFHLFIEAGAVGDRQNCGDVVVQAADLQDQVVDSTDHVGRRTFGAEVRAQILARLAHFFQQHARAREELQDAVAVCPENFLLAILGVVQL